MLFRTVSVRVSISGSLCYDRRGFFGKKLKYVIIIAQRWRPCNLHRKAEMQVLRS